MKLNSEQYAAFGTPTCDIFPTYPVRRETVRIRYRPELTVSDLRQSKAVLWFLWLCVLNVISITTDYEPSIRVQQEEVDSCQSSMEAKSRSACGYSQIRIPLV